MPRKQRPPRTVRIRLIEQLIEQIVASIKPKEASHGRQ